MRVAGLSAACLVLIFSGCASRNVPGSVTEQWSAIQARMHALDARPIAESPPQRRYDAWEASSTYEFTSDLAATSTRVRSALPRDYALVKVSPEQVDYARTSQGDSMYLTVVFEAKPGPRTLVRITWRSLPS